MQAGRELDALIAEKFFGQAKPFTSCLCTMRESCSACNGHGYEKYSTDISAAWQVVEKMIKDGWEVSEAGYSMTTKKWDFTFNNGCAFPGDLAETAPLAICLAALKAVDSKD